jgi:hypothetical protein
MSEQAQRFGRTIVFWAGALGVVASVASTWLILPQRTEAVEHRIVALEQKASADRELLVRIEERLKQVQEELRNRKP